MTPPQSPRPNSSHGKIQTVLFEIKQAQDDSEKVKKMVEARELLNQSPSGNHQKERVKLSDYESRLGPAVNIHFPQQ